MGRREQLSLFRRVMRLHQRSLPEAARALGDRYVREEFRSLNLKNEAQEVEFFREWTDYVAHLELEAGMFGIGRDMAKDTVESMTDDQRAQMDKLRDKLL